MRVQNNIEALFASNRLSTTNNHIGKSLEKLSSGYRINRAGDDAAGLAISEKMRSQIGGLNKAVQNAQDGISLIQTAEGALSESHSILQRMRDLAVQASNGTNTTSDRSKMKDELDQLQQELTRIASNTEFNTKKLLNGALATDGVSFQIGANSGQSVTLNIGSMGANALALTGNAITMGVSNSTGLVQAQNAQKLITTIDSAITQVSQERSKLGANQNRLEHTISNLQSSSENLTAAESRVRDVDMAAEMVSFTKNQILLQAGTAMLAQANAKPQSVLQLLG